MAKKEIDEDLYNDLIDAEHDREEMRSQYESFLAEKKKFEQERKEKEQRKNSLLFWGTMGTVFGGSISPTSSDDSSEIEHIKEEQERLKREAAERERKHQEELRDLKEKQKQAEQDAYYNYLNWHLDDYYDDEADYEEFTDTYCKINKECDNDIKVEEDPDVFTDMAPLSPEDKEREQDHISNAAAMTKDGAFAQAKNEYNKALKINPNNYRAIFGMAKCEVKFKYDTGFEIPYDVDKKYGKLAKNMRISVLEKGALKARQALSHSDASEEEKIRFLNEMAVTLYIASLVFMTYFVNKVNGGKHDDDYWDEYYYAEIDSTEHLEFAFGIISGLDDELSKTNVIKIKNQICNIYASRSYDSPNFYCLACYKKYRDEIKGKVPSDAWCGYTEANPFSREASEKLPYGEKQAAIKEFWEKVDEAEKDGSVADLDAIAKEIEDRVFHKKDEAERKAREEFLKLQQEKDAERKERLEKQKQEIERAAREKKERLDKELKEMNKQREIESKHKKNLCFLIGTIVALVLSIFSGISTDSFVVGIISAIIIEALVLGICKIFSIFY